MLELLPVILERITVFIFLKDAHTHTVSPGCNKSVSVLIELSCQEAFGNWRKIKKKKCSRKTFL